VQLQDIVKEAERLSKLDVAVSFTLKAVYHRLLVHHARKQEIQGLLSTYDDLVYDEEMGQVLCQIEKSGRAFVLRLDPLYPMSGWEGIQILGVEPAKDASEVSFWKVHD
jgi:hypothetical protein